MFFKVIQNKQVHIYNPKDKASLLGLRAYIKTTFKSLPPKFHLQYLDEENDEITLASENDFKIMIETSSKIVKIFVKESDEEYFDQTCNVVLDDEVELSGGSVTGVQAEEKEFQAMVEEQKVEQQKPLLEQPKAEEEPLVLEQSHVSSVSQVTEAEIEQKFKQLLPELIGKVKESIIKESNAKSEIKQKSEIKPPQPEKVIHYASCDECGVKDIEGIRYKCAVCADFDLCEKCQATTTHDHPFLKIKFPRHAPLEIFTVMRDAQQNGFQVNGQNVPAQRFPFIQDIYEALFKPSQQAQQPQEGFRIPRIFKGYCPFKKEENKNIHQEDKVFKKPVEEKQEKVEYKPVPSVQIQGEQKKPEMIIEEVIPGSNPMENANYISSILDIDYNRCYKFALKNPSLTKEELLELYFTNTSDLV